jgi:hypothetical protein
VGTQIELFEAVDRGVWSQLPEEARDDVLELLAGLLLRHVEHWSGAGSEVGDDR